MARILVRELGDDIVAGLKERAKKGQRSLFRYLPGIAGEMSLVRRAFGLI